jgi:metal-responsive CopG/Arc/MetJ family transcriptional regulator
MGKNDKLSRVERLQIMLSQEELEAVDDFRFKQRMPSRAAAVRELCKLGLTVARQPPAQAGQKSTDFGVLKDNSDGARKQR